MAGVRHVAKATVVAMVVVGLTGPMANAEPPAPKRFIVLLHDSERDPRGVAGEHSRRFGAEVHFVYEHAVKGYAATFRGGGAGEVARDSRVRLVEPDGVANISTTQSGATWGLDRIDQRTRTLSSTFSYTKTGAGVTAYVIDTGIRFSHNDFGGRAQTGYDAIDGGIAEDCNGHGTHVAGTIGGATYGVAKGVTLVAVRVLDCGGSGLWSGVIEGVDWVAADRLTRNTPAAVANMSLGGGASTAVDTAVRNSVAAGISYAVAAGNNSRNACNYSPGRVGEALTVGATTTADRRASFSNWGGCLDWFAPGYGITSAWYTSNTATKTISGTSMAAPHTAGLAALYLQSNSGAETSPGTVRDALYNLTTQSVVTYSKSVNNHLLFTNL